MFSGEIWWGTVGETPLGEVFLGASQAMTTQVASVIIFPTIQVVPIDLTTVQK